MKKYDVIVVGGGHAGVESALASSRLNKKTLMLCMDYGTVSLMPCNPAIGGTAKGHLVREIDAMGGQMGIVADKALIQIKMLNSTKGPAVFSLRGQEDKRDYQQEMLDVLKATKHLDLSDDEVTKLVVEDGRVCGVETKKGKSYGAKAVVLATGVYLNGEIITGEYVKKSGPVGYKYANELTKNLLDLGLNIRRFKTGTPARIYRDSIDFSKMTIQSGDTSDRFSFMTDNTVFEEEDCYLTYTNQKTHDIILENIDRSPIYNGSISGIGPRYCPSIETKVKRFEDKERHQIFVEPEGRDSEEMYIQGMSSSMPHDVQEMMYRSLSGLEDCRFARYAYAIEYDCVDPLCLLATLETKQIKNLFSAGQMNGSSGYEEAAAQGLIAGINAARTVDGKDRIVLTRDQAYIGVLIDDLVTKGTNEPYRMMTARAEHRIMLRQDNADMRLTELAYSIGLATEERYQRMLKKKKEIASLFKIESKTMPRDKVREIFERKGEDTPQKTPTFGELCRRPSMQYEDIVCLIDFEISEQAVKAGIIEIKYEGYLKKQEQAIKEQKRLEKRLLPENIDYSEIRALRIEARDKLSEIRPLNLGQASRISGVSPADITVLIVYLSKQFMKINS